MSIASRDKICHTKPMDDSLVVAKRIKEMRERANLTQEELALKLGVSSRTVVRLETGHTKLDYNRLKRIADILGEPVANLINKASHFQSDLETQAETERVEDNMDNVARAIVILRSVVKDKDNLPASDKKLLRDVMLHGAKALEDDPEAEEITSD